MVIPPAGTMSRGVPPVTATACSPPLRAVKSGSPVVSPSAAGEGVPIVVQYTVSSMTVTPSGASFGLSATGWTVPSSVSTVTTFPSAMSSA